MGTIEEKGFLSEEIVEYIEKYRKNNEEKFSLCEDINRFGQKALLSLEVQKEHLPTILVALLLTRVMSNFQGTVLLAERGMMSEAKSLTRCILELMFAIVAIAKDPNFAFKIINNDLFERKRLLGAIIRENRVGPQEINKAKAELAKVEQKINTLNIKEISKWDMADKAGLVSMYNFAYRILSGTIHASVRSLNEYISMKNDKIQSFMWGPKYHGMDLILLTAIDALLSILEGVFQMFTIEGRSELDSLQRRFDKMWKSFEASEEWKISEI